MSSATVGKLGNLLLKINSNVRRNGGGAECLSLQSPFPSKDGSSVADTVASRFLFSSSDN